MKNNYYNGGITKEYPKSNIPNMDFTSLYPTVMKDRNDNIIKLIERRKKINNILNRNSNENII